MTARALLSLAAVSLAATASAQPAARGDDGPREGPVACMPAQAVVPPFNNTAEAMDQSRITATILMDESARAGGKPVRVCRTSAVAPQMAEVEGVDEVPVDPDYEAPAPN